MKNTTKKWLTICGCLAVCAALVVLIGSQLQKEKPVDAPLPSSSSETSNVVVDTEPQEEKKPVVVTQHGTSDATSESTAGVSAGTEQTIQSDIEKPEYTEEQLTDPTKTPDGEPVTTPPVAVDHDKVVQPTEPPVSPSTPQGGDTQNGQVYLPGFGWVTDNGGGGQGTTADDMYENGNKIGSMG